MDRPGQEIWSEITEMAKLLRSYEPSVNAIVQRNTAGEAFGPKDFELFVHIASDVQIVANLIEQLRRREVKFE